MIKSIEPQPDGDIYLGHEVMGMTYRLDGGTVTFTCEGAEIDSSNGISATVAYRHVNAPDTTIWSNWTTKRWSGMSMRTSKLTMDLMHGGYLILECRTRAYTSHFKITFGYGELQIVEIASICNTPTLGNSWKISGMRVCRETYEGFIKAIEKKVSDEQ